MNGWASKIFGMKSRITPDFGLVIAEEAVCSARFFIPITHVISRQLYRRSDLLASYRAFNSLLNPALNSVARSGNKRRNILAAFLLSSLRTICFKKKVVSVGDA